MSKRKKKHSISLAKKYDNHFALQIKIRGKGYYERENVISCIKVYNNYYAKVEGSEKKEYEVTIEVYNLDDTIGYDCDCPCDYPCKHIYAVLLAIDNHDYTTTKLRKEIKKKDYNLQQIIKTIPAKKLKHFMINHTTNNFCDFNTNNFRKEFLNYFPKEKYEYYYNRLYNTYMLQKNTTFYLEIFLENIKEYLSIKNYKQAFRIVKAIIESTNDTNNLEDQENIINILLKLGMYLRIINRKSNNKLKEEIINPWIKKVEKNNYYNNIYLEDIILSIK